MEMETSFFYILGANLRGLLIYSIERKGHKGNLERPMETTIPGDYFKFIDLKIYSNKHIWQYLRVEVLLFA